MKSNIIIEFFCFAILISFSYLYFAKSITLTFSSFLNAGSNDIKIHPLSDGSGYFVNGADGSTKANVWKYLFSSPSSSECQQISNFYQYAYGHLKISDSSMFMAGVHILSPYQLHFYKHTFGETSPDWSLKLSWPFAFWTKFISESLLISPSIYAFFPYGSTSVSYVYMAVISLSDGTVSNRHKSSCYLFICMGIRS